MSIGQIFELVSLVAAGVASLGIVTWQLVLYIGRAARDLHDAITEVDNARMQDARELRALIAKVEASLDEKYNKARDEISHIKDDYVRRDDLGETVRRIEQDQRDLMGSMKTVGDKLDEVLLSFARRGAE